MAKDLQEITYTVFPKDEETEHIRYGYFLFWGIETRVNYFPYLTESIPIAITETICYVRDKETGQVVGVKPEQITFK